MPKLVPDVVIVFDLDGERKRLDYKRLPWSTWEDIKQSPGFTAYGLLAALEKIDPPAIACILWLERKQRERSLRYVEVSRQIARDLEAGIDHDFELVDLIVDGEAMTGDGAEPTAEANDVEAEADPTTRST